MNTRHRPAPLVAGLIALAAYAATLAPGVTFEDSGDFIASAYVTGIPHEPGYPLYTMLAHVFTWLPLGSVAWRVNLFSALTAALGVFFFTRALQRCAPPMLALCGGLLAAFSREGWSQSLITEVYGLNLALFGITLDLLTGWAVEEDPSRQRRALPWLALVLGLAASNHSTAALWSPAALIAALRLRPRQLVEPRLVWRAVLAYAAGLTPLLYLPWAASRDPALNWGDPGTWQNFVRVVTRNQYGVDPAHSLHDVYVQLAFFVRLTAGQWPALLLLFVPPGLWLLFREQRRLLWPVLLLWLASGPLVAVLTNFPVATPNAATNAENAALASVFFIPAHWLTAFVIALGIFFFLRRLNAVPAPAAGALALLLPATVAVAQWQRVDMSQQVFAERYVEGLFALAGPDALILTTWDPYTFPTLYYQYVEKQRQDVTVLDQFTLSTSWYVRRAQRKAPAILDPVKSQAEAFLDAIAPFEAGEPSDYASIYPKYRALVDGIVGAAIAHQRDVLLTFTPPAELASRYAVEPVYWGYRLRATPAVTTVDPAALRVEDFLAPAVRQDRMATYMRDALGSTIAARLRWCQPSRNCGDRAALEALAPRFAAAAPGPLAPSR